MCTGETSVDVTENDLPVVNVTGNQPFCTGEAIILDAGAGYTNYQWSNNTSGQTLNVNVEGNYSVTVTDVNGCTGVDMVFVTEAAELAPQIGGELTYCVGSNTVLDAGPGFATYLWSDNSTESSIFVNEEGSYRVRVTNECGSASDDVFIRSKDCECFFIYFRDR